MSLSTARLKEMIEAAAGGFALSAGTLAVPEAEPLFADYLGGDLVLENGTGDAERLLVRGTLAGGAEALSGLPAAVRFASAQDDGGDAYVTGLEIAVTWPGWEVDAPFLQHDLSALVPAGFTDPLVVLSAQPDGYGEVLSMAVPAAALGMEGAPGVPAYVKFLPVAEEPLEAAESLPRRATAVGEFGDGLVFTSTQDLAALPFFAPGIVDDWQLPGPVAAALSSLRVMDATAELHWDGAEFTHVSVGVELDTGDGWTLIDGLLVLDGFSGWLTADTGGDEELPRVCGGLAARLRAGDSLVLEAGLTVPDGAVSGSAYRPDGGLDLIGDELPDGLGRSATELQYCSVYCDPATRDCLLVLGLDLEWGFTDGLALTGLILELSGKGGGMPDATVIGTLRLGRADDQMVVCGTRDAGGAWSVSGTVTDISFKGFADWFAVSFGARLPEAVTGLELSEVSLTFDSTRSGEFRCSGTLPLGESTPDAAFVLRAAVGHEDGKRTVTFSASLDVALDFGDDEPYPMSFEVKLGTGGDGTRLTASWTAGDKPIPVLSALAALGLDGLDELEDVLPAALRPELRALTLGYDAGTRRTVLTASTERVTFTVASVRDALDKPLWALQAVVAVDMRLSQLPLLSGLLPAQAELAVHAVRLVASSVPVPGLLLTELNEAAGGTPFPVLDKSEGGLPGGVWLALEYTAPGLNTGLLSLPVGGRSPSDATPAALPAAPEGTPARVPATVPDAPAQGDRPGAWVEVGRAFGPLHIRRLGASYEAGTVWLMVDGELTAAGFSLSVSGLALGADLDAEGFPVRARLAGLGVEFARPPLTVSGALVNRIPPPDGYTLMVGGMLVVQLPTLGLTAVGAYQRRTDGMPSLFVFGRGTMALGGSPKFRVRRLAAGFGFNSSLRIPEAGAVEQFPLLSGLDGNLPEDPMEMLDRLTGEWVSPDRGQLWLAAGIDFTSFEFIAGRLLALLEVGDTLTLALLGTARAAFPRKGRAYAQVKLELRIVYSSARGAFEAGAQLYDSYVIDPSCSLTGGFAYTMWFDGSPHAGDFALTAGGYHPAYEPPGHYPRVPRLGFSWSLGLVEITGEAYFALTPSAIMAGGTLDVRYRSGPLKAWLTARANVLVSWNPVYFTAGIGITIGASLKLLFITLKGELGASLDLWGPPTGGRVTAKFVFVEVTVAFGADRSNPPAIKWPEFTELLPPPEQVLKIAARSGLRTGPDEEEADGGREDGGEPWVVDPAGFSFAATTSVPASQVCFQDEEFDTGPKLDIRPMECRQLTSTLTVTVARDTAPEGAAALWETLANDGSWRSVALRGDVPTALWGKPGVGDGELVDSARRLVRDVPTGIEIVVPPPVTTGGTVGPIPEESLAYEDLPDTSSPVHPDDPATGDHARQAVGNGVGTVANSIAQEATAVARSALRTTLDELFEPLPDAPLTGYRDSLRTYGLPADPLLTEAAR